MRLFLSATVWLALTAALHADELVAPGAVIAEESIALPADAPDPILSPAEQALHDYLYVTYPRYVAALSNQIKYAQATVDVWAARVDSYRPFQSFGRYAPTWTAEQDARLALLAAEQRLQTLRRIEADLWIYHRANIARLSSGAACRAR